MMGQYYNITQNTYLRYIEYNYTDQTSKNTFQNIWDKNYELIVNCNVIIDNCGESSPILPGFWHGLVKGEALALRAMLHLDLLRLYGPIPNEEGKLKQSIPYVTNTDQKISPFLTMEEVGNRIIQDLKDALKLLENTDPILTEGVMNSADPQGNNTTRYRQYRLNYFAAKSLLARTYLWCGKRSEALTTAREIINDAQINGTNIFPFVTSAAATNTSAPDRVFSSEVIFALYDPNRRTEIHEYLFAPTLADDRRLTFAGTLASGRVPELYDDQNDHRYKAWATYNRTNGSTALYHRKLDIENTLNIAFSYMVPLIRLSEIYLIAAECTENLTEAEDFLNTIRRNRNCVNRSVTSSALIGYITSEFRREVLGEGQMFFFYKRLGLTTLPNVKANSGNINMNLNNYVVPLPDSETSVRLDY
jgi:hypothetical protein